MRFPGFSGEWESSNLGEIARISKGVGISKDQRTNDGNPCILYGELYTTYSTEIIDEIVSKTNLPAKGLVKSVANDVIIPASGETAIDISTARCVTKSDVFLGGDLNIIRLKGHDGKFFSYQLNGVRKKDIAKVAQGVSIVHLHGSDLETVRVCYPSRREQEKISGLLSLIDQRIAIQNRVIERYESLIKALYQKIMSLFQGVSTPLGEIVQIQKGKQINSEFLSTKGKYYVMNGGIAPSGYYHQFNTEANTISISEGGNSCGYVQYNAGPYWSGGHCYSLLCPKDIVDYRFLYHYLKYRQDDIMALRIGSGLPNIQKKDIERFLIILPSIDVQKKLASFFDEVSSRYSLAGQEKAYYEKLKAYLVFNMFI